MEKYVGLDVSMEETSVCVVDGGGNIVFEGKTSSQPDALSKLLRAKASDAARIVHETGSLASSLWHQLRREAIIRYGFHPRCGETVIVTGRNPW